ncbi:MAG: hydrogenase nickel incorporation protein HypB [Geobacteraceae bacterium]|nr:hydrogenase nickel incorporation protein HypB [Geobacteraceae bacterium]
MGRIEIRRNILEANENLARQNREFFSRNGVLVVNIMAAPGAGKTSTILKTIEALHDRFAFAVIEGDMASRIDADVMAERGIPVEQINTGNMCHLDANMIRQAAVKFTYDRPTILFIENVGNLVCPSEFSLGEDLNIVIASTTEGHDKPYKYPSIYLRADVVLINKIDLLEAMEFDRKMFCDGVAAVKPMPPLFEISCRNGSGLDDWACWLAGECERKFGRTRGKLAEG